MDSTDDAVVDALATDFKVHDYGRIQLVDVPGIEVLNKDQLAKLAIKIEEKVTENPIDADALGSALRLLESKGDENPRFQDDQEGGYDANSDRDSATPPPDPEDEEEYEARDLLEKDGGIPCYPPELGFPVRDPPEEYREIVEYWRSKTSRMHPGSECIIDSQYWDWKLFRDGQLESRKSLDTVPLSDLEDTIRQHRKDFGFPDCQVRLCTEVAHQNQAQNLIEHLEYQFHKHFELEEKLASCKQRLEEYEDTYGTAQHGIDSYTEQIKEHKVLMRWIDEQRSRVESEQHRSEEDGAGAAGVEDQEARHHESSSQPRKAEIDAESDDADSARPREHSPRSTQPSPEPVLSEAAKPDEAPAEQISKISPRSRKRTMDRRESPSPQRSSKSRGRARSVSTTGSQESPLDTMVGPSGTGGAGDEVRLVSKNLTW